MSVDVDAAWTEDVGVRDLTDTDLLAARNKSTSFQDPEGEYRSIAHGIMEREGLENESAAVDHALRIYLAYLFDSGRVDDLRDDYDVKYLIPPGGWALNYNPDSIDDPEDIEPDVDTDYLYYSLPPEVKGMADDVVESDESDFDELQELVKKALRFVARVE